MENINAFYNYIEDMVKMDNVILEKTEPYNFQILLNKLNLEKIRIEADILSPLYSDGHFQLTGTAVEDGEVYICNLLAYGDEKNFECTLELVRKLQQGTLLNHIYPPAKGRLAINGYSTPVDVFENVFISQAVITADTRDASDMVSDFKINIYIGEESPLYIYYKALLPNRNQWGEFQGTVQNPFTTPHYQVELSYVKELYIPFLAGSTMANRLRLLIKSHIEDIYGINDSDESCEVSLFIDIPLPGYNDREITLFYSLFDHSQSFFLNCIFGESGLGFGDGVHLIEGMTGKSGDFQFPEWISSSSLTLKGMVLHLSKNVAEKANTMLDDGEGFSYGETPDEDIFYGAAFYFNLELPSLPIPFFDKLEGSGAAIQLAVQWDHLEMGGFLDIYLGFMAQWKQHSIKVNIMLPELTFKGEYERLDNVKTTGNSLFPGFMDLNVEYIRLWGNLRDSSYWLDFDLENNNVHNIPIGKAVFLIDEVRGTARYSSYGIEVGVSLGFILLGTRFSIAGSYSKTEAGTELSMEGGLSKELSLANLISLVTGDEVNKANMDFVIKGLYFTYLTKLSEGQEGTDSIEGSFGKPLEFSFLCSVEFSWVTNQSIGSTFHIQWKDNIYTLKLSAYINLLDYFLFSASCKVLIDDGKFTFEDYEFITKIGSLEVRAGYNEAGRSLKFTVTNFNLGELIEGLVNIVARDHNWYLPWPFQILKQITIKELQVIFDNEKSTIQARLFISFKILFLEVNYIELFYDRNNEDFFINISVNGSVEADQNEVLNLNLLKDIFPSIGTLGEQLFNVEYMALGQHIEVEIPTSFDEVQFETIVDNMKKAITKNQRPNLSADNNWVFALKLKLVKSIDITLLMCDPSFYGAKITISKGCEFTDPFSGLAVTILYSKINETIGMFYAKLTLPEIFRVIELGAIQVRIGEIALAIYTNGNFKIDIGFPYNKDFSRSFGLTYLFFTGKGGFYFGLLNGDTSRAVPNVTRGHFETVVELGIGISAGVSRELSFGPLKAGAYLLLVGIFQGVFANYIPENENSPSSYYYNVQATVGVTASIYGSVDFVLVKVGFQISAVFMMDLTLERYKQTILNIEMDLRVQAYIKIWFIKINFSFHFSWNHSMTLGSASTAPWEISQENILLPKENYSLEWYEEAVFTEKQQLFIEVAPYFSYDKVRFNNSDKGTPKIAFVGILNGFQQNSWQLLEYGSAEETPLPILVELLLRRLIMSVRADGKPVKEVSRQLLEWLHNTLEDPDTFNSGFSSDILDEFLGKNICLNYSKGENYENVEGNELHGIPFPLPKELKLTWFSAPDITVTYDLSAAPILDAGYFERVEQYYQDLYVDISQDKAFKLTEDAVSNTAAAFVFGQYFYMVSKIVLSSALSEFDDSAGSITLDDLVKILHRENVLNNISGMVSRFCYGGLRAIVNDNNVTDSLYSFALQQFDALSGEGFSEDEIIHRMKMEFMLRGNDAIRLLPRMNYLHNSNWNIGATVLEWELRPKDMSYPKGQLDMTDKPSLQPLYSTQPKTMGLKNPKKVMGDDITTFFEAESLLPENFSVILSEKDSICKSNWTKSDQVDFSKGCLIYLTVYTVADNVYSIGAIGLDNIARLKNLKVEQDIKAEIFRQTNSLDEDDCGFSRLGMEEVFLYRTNLCLEAEKPMLKGVTNDNYENSAYIDNAQGFLSLLWDASLVNSKGYYLRLQLDKQHAVENKELKLILFVQSNTYCDAVKLLTPYDKETEKPIVLTDDISCNLAFKPGTFGFSMKAAEADDDLKRAFQMLRYQVIENEFFRKSNESTPLMLSNDYYSQIIPAVRFAKEQKPSVGEKINPYNGIKAGSRITLGFSLLDILGNETEIGATMDIPYGYTDPLISPTTYPYTKCTYWIDDKADSYEVNLEFSYQEEEQEEKRELAREVFWQLACEDIGMSMTVQGQEINLDVQPLRNFMEEVSQYGSKPSNITYKTNISKPQDKVVEINIDLSLFRDRSLLEESLAGTAQGDAVIKITQPVGPDQEKIARNYIAQRGRDGQLFLIREPVINVDESINYTLPPLSNKLFNLREIQVLNMDGTQTVKTFGKIDLEEWADCFLGDFEKFIEPGSIYSGNQELLEKLLDIKKQLAEKITNQVCAINSDKQDEVSLAIAKRVFKNELYRHLYNGRKLDAVSVYKLADGSLIPDLGNAYLYSGKTENSNISLNCQKTEADGYLPISVRVSDIAMSRHISADIKIKVTDIEHTDGVQYDYLALQNAKLGSVMLECDIPYKRFPALPVLVCQDYEKNGVDNCFGYSYGITFSHEASAQDELHIKLILNESLAGGMESPGLPYALAQYMNLRNQFISANVCDSQTEKMLLLIAGQILENWSIINWMKRTSQTKYRSLTLNVDRENKRIYLTDTELECSKITMELQKVDGEFITLLRQDNIYELPDENLQFPYVFRIIIDGFDIQTTKNINGCISVVRNQNIKNMESCFKYETEEISFPEPLEPWIYHYEPYPMGTFERDNVIKSIMKLADGFSGIRMELYCGVALGGNGEDALFSYLPVFFIPQAEADEIEAVIGQLYSNTKQWLDTHFPGGRKGNCIRVNISFYGNGTEKRNLAELSSVIFEVPIH